MKFQDIPTDTISITPVAMDAPSSGYTISPIKGDGLQNSFKVIDQILDSLNPSPGTFSSSDSVIGAINKIIATLPTYYSTIHVTSASGSSINLSPFQRCIIIDPSVTGKSITLPAADASGVIPGVEYIFLVGGGIITNNTIKVPVGGYLNNVLNGTYTLSGLLSGWVRMGCISDGVKWYSAP